MGRRAAIVLMVVAALVMASGTALAVTYTTSKKVSLRLNKANYVGTALTRLASNAVGPALTVETDSTEGAATPLRLQTETGSQPPMSVNSETRVDNLNADKLDGKSSEEFADGSNITSGTVSAARIDSAIARDSEVANGYMQGRGMALHRARALDPGQNLFIWEMSDPALSLSYNCPANLASNGFIGIKNTSATEIVNAFSDNGLDDPFYNPLDPNEFWSQGASAAGEHITFQVQGTYVATIEVFSAHRTSDNKCHVQGQAVVTKP